MQLRKLSPAAAIASILPVVAAQAAPAVDCRIGPVEKTFGGTKWLVYGCDDKTSVVVVTAPGNPAMPFYFFFSRTPAGYHLQGEGTGNKTFTDAAYTDLSALTDSDIAAMGAEAARQ
jgi:hypothetical protein